MNRTIYPTTIRHFNEIFISSKKVAPLVSESPARVLLAGQIHDISEDKTMITIYDGTGSISLSAHADSTFPFAQNDVVRAHILTPSNTTASIKTLFCEKLPNAEALLVHFLSSMNAIRLTDDKTQTNGQRRGYGAPALKDTENDFLRGFDGGQAAFY